MENKKIAVSYSGGKDGALALHRLIQAGYAPAALLTTCRTGGGRSWFHGIPERLLDQISESTGIPLIRIETDGGDYEEKFVWALKALRRQGVTACAFGDIDIQEHYDWCDNVCRAAGLESLFPLWGESREKLVHEGIDAGLRAMISIVDASRMPVAFLGRTLTRELAAEIALSGADVCGENGEYHTFVWDGPIFKAPIEYRCGEAMQSGNYRFLPLI